MKKFLIAGIAAVAFCSASALAADLPVKGYNPEPAVFNWTGFYVGANIGSLVLDSHTAIPSQHIPPTGGAFAYGGQTGFNYQMGMLVVGVETSGDWRKKTDYNTVCANSAFTCHLSISNQYDVRGRVGLAMNNVLIYGTAGESWTNPRGFTQSVAGVFPGGTNRSGTIWGGGAEMALAGNWILGAEYLATDYGTKTILYDTFYQVPVKTWEARARLSYLFSWGGKGPVVAKY